MSTAPSGVGEHRGDLSLVVRWFNPAETDVVGLALAAELAATEGREAAALGPATEGREAAALGPSHDAVVWLHVPDVGGDRDAAVVTPWLSRAERERRARIQHPRALAEFLAGRRVMRSLLAPLVGATPEGLALVESERGALALDGTRHDAGWYFNLSHTDGLLAFALARRPIGVDVEWTTRRGRTVALADRFFAPSEVAALRALPEAAQRDRFFDLWTLKEAYIKARGLGLALPLDAFAFTVEERALSIAVQPSVADAPDAAWRFWLASVGAAHRLALALRD